MRIYRKTEYVLGSSYGKYDIEEKSPEGSTRRVDAGLSKREADEKVHMMASAYENGRLDALVGLKVRLRTKLETTAGTIKAGTLVEVIDRPAQPQAKIRTKAGEFNCSIYDLHLCVYGAP